MGVMRNNTPQNRHAFGEILNRAAWDYKYVRSWQATNVQNHQATDKAFAGHDTLLHHCIDDYSVKDFKAYKVRMWHKINTICL